MDIKNSAEIHVKYQTSVNPSIHKYWIGGYAVCALLCLIVYFFIRQHVFGILKGEYLLLQKIALGAFFSLVVLLAGRVSEMFVVGHSHSKVFRYNLVRMMRLLTGIFILAKICPRECWNRVNRVGQPLAGKLITSSLASKF